jgi:hypothetical protein
MVDGCLIHVYHKCIYRPPFCLSVSEKNMYL